jgi:LacI family transcriptional regulator
MVTLHDVAKHAGVHLSTVSRALDPVHSHMVRRETIERVSQAAAELGYRPNKIARGLRKGRTGAIGVVVADLGNPFLPPIIRGMAATLAELGIIVLVAETQDEDGAIERILSDLQSRKVDAIITTAARLDDRSLMEEVNRSIPVVLAVRTFLDGTFHAVTHDDALGGSLAVRHLHGLGHRRLVELSGPTDVSSFVGRSRGVATALGELDEQVDHQVAAADRPTTAEGYRLMSEILADGEPPTAVFAHNDLMAVGAIDALVKAGIRCPTDVSVMGYNDSTLTDHLDPPLTTVRFASFQIGSQAAQLARSLLDDPEQPVVSRSLAPTLVQRVSTAQVPAG